MASDDSWASTFFPESLVQASVVAGSNLRFWSTRTVTFGSSAYLAVAYSNGISGVLRLLRINGEAASLISERANLDGAAPDLEAVDIDNDHVPELVASYQTGRRGERTSYIYRWTGSALAPLANGRLGRDGGFNTVSFADIDGDGVMEVLEPRSTAGDDALSETTSGGFDTYKLVNGTLRLQTNVTLQYVGVFSRSTGTPKVITDEFDAQPGQYLLHITNGDQAGNVVNSAEIRLNGAVIFGPAQFKPIGRTLSAPVTLAALNTITVELRSAPESTLTITLSRATPTTP
jgi:hypothetical protein